VKRDDVAGAALVALAFAGYSVVLRVVAPPAAAQWAAADPFLKVMPPLLVPALAFVAVAAWRLPSRAAALDAARRAATGQWLSASAGLGEELLFRLALLPALLALLLRAPVLAVALTGLAFAGLHELRAGAVRCAAVLTRLIFPGIVMSAAAWLFKPSFIVSAHCTAHVLLPLVFA
jgi:hypothetical protein